jgi:hypothetical protein
MGCYHTDSDYSDFYVDYQPEYDNNALFYLDTQSRKFIYRSGELRGSNWITLFNSVWSMIATHTSIIKDQGD